MGTMHSDALRTRWLTFSIFEQMGNAGSEVGRTIAAQRRGDARSAALAFDRALELLDFTLEDPRWSWARKHEIGRARELFCDLVVGENSYGTDPDSLERYFMQFALAARKGR